MKMKAVKSEAGAEQPRNIDAGITAQLTETASRMDLSLWARSTRQNEWELTRIGSGHCRERIMELGFWRNDAVD
jgi:hypothetical protein